MSSQWAMTMWRRYWYKNVYFNYFSENLFIMKQGIEPAKAYANVHIFVLCMFRAEWGTLHVGVWDVDEITRTRIWCKFFIICRFTVTNFNSVCSGWSLKLCAHWNGRTLFVTEHSGVSGRSESSSLPSFSYCVNFNLPYVE